MDTHWCAICDKHTPGGLYCSEECRLADLAGASDEHPRETYKRGSDIWTPTLYRRRASQPDNRRPPRSVVVVVVANSLEPTTQLSPTFDPNPRIVEKTVTKASASLIEPRPSSLLDPESPSSRRRRDPPPKKMVARKSSTTPAETTPTAVTTSTSTHPLPSPRYPSSTSSRCHRFNYYDEKYSALVLRSRPVTTLVFGH